MLATFFVVSALVSCATTPVTAPADALRADLETRLAGAGLDASVEVPFALTPTTRAEVVGQLRPTGDDASRVARVVDYIFSDLDLRYALTPTRDAEQVYRQREGNCLSFVNLFVALGRYMQLAPFFVEVEDYQRWDHRRGMVVSRGHVVGGVYVGGALRTFDFLPYRPKGYRTLRPIDDIVAVAHFRNNLGAEALLTGDLDLAAEHLEVAVALAPRLIDALNNLAVLRARRGDDEEAVSLYRRALEVESGHVPVLENLGRLLERMGRRDEAAAVAERVASARRASPFFFLSKAEVALADGDAGGALELLRQALSRDAEIPRLHVGLTKTYLALGEIDKARHHLARARALDADGDEVRRLTLLLGGVGVE
ncbi:MAG: tetratricopeptide repeat protein [Acidobacteriota bacterium]